MTVVLRSLHALIYLLSWQAKEARKEREAQVAKVQMEAALSKGVSWGMAGDDQVLGQLTLCLVPDVPPRWRICSPPALALSRVQNIQDGAAPLEVVRQALQVIACSDAASV